MKVKELVEMLTSMDDIEDGEFAINKDTGELLVIRDATRIPLQSGFINTSIGGNSIITKNKFNLAAKCLIDNGIENDEVETILQALCYILLDEDVEKFFSNSQRKLKYGYGKIVHSLSTKEAQRIADERNIKIVVATSSLSADVCDILQKNGIAAYSNIDRDRIDKVFKSFEKVQNSPIGRRFL